MKTHLHSLLLGISLLSTAALKAQIPLMNSFPDATATVYLDFDGEEVIGTSWNWNGPIICAPSGLSTAQVTEIVNRISEDFRPFQLNITTDLSKFLAAPINQRIRLIYTVSSAWFGSAGGTAMIGSFGWGDDTPAFVFSQLLNYNTRILAEAGSHEIGHSLSLLHQSSYDANCVWLSEYNYGQGLGEIGWAPIMGNPYNQNLTRWNNGPNTYGCNNLQDELSMITTANNFGYRDDDHEETVGRATSVQFNNNQFQVSGIIEQNTDKDMFRFNLPADGQFRLNATPVSAGANNSGSNLDIKLSLQKRHQYLNGYSSASSLNSQIDTFLNKGTYFVKVEGESNVYASAYATLGSYNIQGNLTETSVPLQRIGQESLSSLPLNKPVVPRLVNNIVTNSLSVISPGSFNYTILNVNGSPIVNGNIGQGTRTIMFSVLTSGMYYITFTNGVEQTTVKFIKQ